MRQLSYSFFLFMLFLLMGCSQGGNPGDYFPAAGKKQLLPSREIEDPVGVNLDYPVLSFGDQEWLGRNLQIGASGASCVFDDKELCPELGRLYTQVAARLACGALGEGWRLPTEAEWQELLLTYGGFKLDNGQQLKSKGPAPAAALKNLTYGKSPMKLLYAGVQQEDQSFTGYQELGAYWTAEETDLDVARAVVLDKPASHIRIEALPKKLRVSCRCVRDLE